MDYLVWVDLEMTGLDVDKETIMEMSCLITNGNLDIIAEGPEVIIHHTDEQLEKMNDWCKKHHGESGLTERCRKIKTTIEEAQEMMLSFVAKHTQKGVCPLAGNTVYMDKRFLEKFMPKFVQHLHYRIVDVSTVKELCRRWYPFKFTQAPVKTGQHRSLDDIKESIEELKFYRKNIFIEPTK